MVSLVFVGALLALGIALALFAPRIPGWVPAAILFAMAAGIFAARAHHAGPYAFPFGPDLVHAALALTLGLLLVRPRWRGEAGARAPVRRVVFALTPVAFFAAASAILHEVEEVVVVRTRAADGRTREARLWVVDREGDPWVVTGQATRHARDIAARPRVELVRDGAVSCRIAESHVDHETIAAMLVRRHEKYFVQRLAVAAGVWSGDLEGIEETAVAIRLAPCPADPGGSD